MKTTKLLMIMLAFFLFTGTATIVSAQNKPDNKKVEKDDDADDSPQAQAEMAKLAKISKDEASRTALQKVPGEIIESELDRETGRLVYEFKIRNKSGKNQEVLVDAKTGELVSVEAEGDEDDDTNDNSQAKQNANRKWYAVWRKIPGLKKL